MRRLTLLSLILLALVLPGIASAKYLPYLEDQAAEWGDIAAPYEVPTSQVFAGMYGRLGMYGDVDVFAYDITEPQTQFMIEALVPECGAHFTAFEPSIALIGPGIESSEGVDLPFDLPEGMVALPITTTVKVNAENAAYFGAPAQSHMLDYADLPESGTYYVAVWEPNGNVGAYTVSTGSLHPENIPQDEMKRVNDAFNVVNSGEWMGQDCEAPLAVENCPATDGEQTGDVDVSPAPVRSKVGTGDYTLMGIALDSSTCLPIAGAEILVWLATENGEYDDDHRATLITNGQGGYRLDSNRPGGYGPEPHIHMYITAPGYAPLMTTLVVGDEDIAEFSFALQPE